MNESFVKTVKKVVSTAKKVERAPKKVINNVKKVVSKPGKVVSSAVKTLNKIDNPTVPKIKDHKIVKTFKKFVKSKWL